MAMRTRSRLVVAAVSALLLLTAPGVRAEDVAGVTPTVVKIAILDALSGPYAQYGTPGRYGAQYVFDEVNARGGVNGRKIEVVVEDDGCSPQNSVAAATKLIKGGEVFAVLGLTCSAASVAVKDSVAKSTGAPFLSESAGGWTSSAPDRGGLVKSFFYLPPSVHTQAGSIVNFVMNVLKAKRVALLAQTDVYGKEGTQGVVDMLKKYDAQLVGVENIEARVTDVSIQVAKMKELQPDAIITFLYQIPAQLFLRQAYELGLTVPVVASASVTDPAMYTALPEAALAKFYGTTLGKDVVEGPALKEPITGLRRAFPRVTFNPLTWSGFAGAEVYVEALRRAGKDLTREKFVTALESLKDFPSRVAAFPITFTRDNHMAGRGLHFFRVEKGVEVSAMDGYWSGTDKTSAPAR